MNQSNNPVFTVPLNPSNNDYLPIDYNSDYPWNNEDKDKIKKVVNELFNALKKHSAEIVNTSVGSVTITAEPHPVGDRRKLVQGFLTESLKLKAKPEPEEMSSKQLIDLLEVTTPDWIKNNPDALEEWAFFQKRVSQLQISEETLKTKIFLCMLDFVELLGKESNNDEHLQIRLKNWIENIKTFSPEKQ
jgi:hypothetical protein